MGSQNELTDEQLLTGLRENHYPTLQHIYARFTPGTIKWVRRQGGRKSDALDVLQETLIVIYRKANTPDFVLNTSFGAYLAGVRRYIWWHQLRKKKQHSEVTLDDQAAFIIEDNIENELIGSEKRLLFQEKLNQLGSDCQKVLRSFFAGEALKTIADQLGYTYDYIKKKNRVCKEKLTAAVKKDPRYTELIDGLA